MSGVLNNTMDGDQCCQLCRSVPTTLQGYLCPQLDAHKRSVLLHRQYVAYGICFIRVTPGLISHCIGCMPASAVSDEKQCSAEARRGAMCGCGARSPAAARQGAAASPTWGASSSTRPMSAPAPRHSRCRMHGAADPPQPLCQVRPAFTLTRQLACFSSISEGSILLWQAASASDCICCLFTRHLMNLECQADTEEV